MDLKLEPDNHILMLAPMADLTHGGFRSLVDHYGGCDLYYTEMIDARLYRLKGPFEKYYESTLPQASRVVFQLVGPDPVDMGESAKELALMNPAGIDINMGCSAPHIARSGAGCALMETPDKAARMVETLRRVLPDSIAVSAKLRLGEKESPERLISFARRLEEAGADYLTLHPKTRREKGSRPPRRDFIGLLQKELTIPVAANGHIWSWEGYRHCWENQKPGASMLGRQIARQPWFFELLKRKIANDTPTPLKVDLQDCWERFFEGLMEHQPLEFHKSRARRFSLYFSENLHFGHTLHAKFVTNSPSAGETNRIYTKYFRKHPEEKIREYAL